jgi:plastocyanin
MQPYRFPLALLLLAAALGSFLPEATSKTVADKKLYVPTGSEGAISGNILFAGIPPAAARIDMSADPLCPDKRSPKTEFVIINNGQLANVFVYVKSGEMLDEFSFGTPTTPVVVAQQDCRFIPHVVGVQVNQTIEFHNRDQTVHNVHPKPKVNREFNQSYIPGAQAIQKRFSWPEVMIPIKDNQHPWMAAYVGVLPHPFFSVTNGEGMFRITGLPAGKYMIAAWHEKLGEKTMEVTVSPYSQQQLSFEFSADDGGKAGRIRAEP